MLKLDYVKLEEAAKSLKDEGIAFEDCIKNMPTVIGGLPDIWEAETCDQYVDQYNDAKPTLEDVKQLIFDMSTQMQKISQNFAQADSDMKKQMAGGK